MLEAAGVEFDIIEYMKAPPDRDTLADLANRLDRPAADLVRKDPRFHSLGLDANDYESADEVAKLLALHPALMQRPLIDDGTTVVIARPPARAEEWLDKRSGA